MSVEVTVELGQLIEGKKQLGQAAQDYFIQKATQYKKNGQFLEIGTNDPVQINNSFLLEQNLGWKGILVEQDPSFLPKQEKFRPNSVPIIQDATTIDQKGKLEELGFPKKIDSLQIDLEVDHGTTLKTLEHLENTVMGDTTFSVVLFEHDIYRGDYFNTRAKSRYIFESHGQERVFSDVSNQGKPFEDWQVHPDHVNMDWVNRIRRDESLDQKEIVKILDAN